MIFHVRSRFRSVEKCPFRNLTGITGKCSFLCLDFFFEGKRYSRNRNVNEVELISVFFGYKKSDENTF